MKAMIIQALLDWNPWLEGKFPEELLGFERDYNILSYLDVPEIKILEGARRVGKSTLLYQVIRKIFEFDQRVLYINFDDPALRKLSVNEILETYQEKAEVKYLFIDEIQNCENWVPSIRKLYDLKIMNQIWISGSNSSIIKKEYATLLTGRALPISIFPLSFKEYLRFHQIKQSELPPSTKSKIEIKKQFKSFLEYGGFPAVVLRVAYKKELLINYFEDFIYKDIAARYDVNSQKIKDLGIYLASQSGKTFSYRKLAAALNIHLNTVMDYFTYLQEVFLFEELYKFDYSLKTQTVSEKKIYALDTGLAAALAFRFSEDKGRILENAVHAELKRRHLELYFLKAKKECDFIVKEGTQITSAYQVCYSLEDQTTKEREFAGLLEAMKIFNLEQGLILTMDESGLEKINHDGQVKTIKIIPVWEWLLQ